MKTLHLNIPDKANLEPNDVAKFLASKQNERCKLTPDQADQMVGMHIVDFAEISWQYGASLFGYPAEYISKDVLNP